MQLKISTLRKILYFDLVGLVFLPFFTGLCVGLILAFSTAFRYYYNGLSFADIPNWIWFCVFGVPIFFLANFCLFLSETFIEKHITKLDSLLVFWKIVVLSLSLVVLICLMIVLGFVIFLPYLYLNFWI